MTSDHQPDGTSSLAPDARARSIRTTRRRLLGGVAGTAVALGVARLPGAGAARVPISMGAARAQFASPATPQAATPVPADAAPLVDQVFVRPSDPTFARVFDLFEAANERPMVSDLFSDPLVRMDRNHDIIPAAATSWSANADNTVWTFQLDPNLVWSDGNPVTARDYVRTFQYGADPQHAWDFAWFFMGKIRNWSEALSGSVPPDQVGIRQGDSPNQVIVEAVDPTPYMPALMLYAMPLSAAALDGTGPLYNTNPATAVSSGPFILDEFSQGQRIVFRRNPSYRGTLTPLVQKVIVDLAAPNTWFTLYQTGEIDFMEGLAPQELQLAEADPQMSKELWSAVFDFRTWYLFFDTTQAPFSDLRVRQAFSHAVDRDTIERAILTRQGIPAYSMLAPGFSGANGEALKGIQNYDPDTAKQLLAAAGFPDGKGFPKQSLALRNESALNQTLAQAIAAALGDILGIEVEVSNLDNATFTAQLKTIPFGGVSYGMDYLDPSNLLGIWQSNVLHSWADPDYDAAYHAANVFTGDPAQRIAMFQALEKTLVEQVPAVFVYHATPVQLIKPYLTGPFLAPDRDGFRNLHWPGYTDFSTVTNELYLGQGAPSGRG